MGLERPLESQEFEAPGISIESINEDNKVVNPTHQPPLLSVNNPGTYFC